MTGILNGSSSTETFSRLPPIFDVVLVIEDTTLMGATVDELYESYIVPSIDHFNAGLSRDQPWCSPSCSTTFTIVAFKNADFTPGCPVSRRGPFVSVNKFLEAFRNLKFSGGGGEWQSCGAEGLAMALDVLDSLEELREKDKQVVKEHSKHVIYVANSPAYDMPVQRVKKYADCTLEELLEKIASQQINFSVIAPRKIPNLVRMYSNSGGDMGKIKEKNYAKQATHFVALSGYELPTQPVQTTPVPTLEAPPPQPAAVAATEPQTPVMRPMNPQQQPFMNQMGQNTNIRMANPGQMPGQRPAAATAWNNGGQPQPDQINPILRQRLNQRAAQQRSSSSSSNSSSNSSNSKKRLRKPNSSGRSSKPWVEKTSHG